jgi:excinuclease ABC subunit C
VLIDGGKGQLAAVEQALQRSWETLPFGSEEEQGGPPAIELAALAKGRHGQGDRVFRTGRKNPLPLRSGERELLFLQNLRDSVHRFVLSRQKKSRTKPMLDSELSRLPGVGPQTARLLWDHFGSVENLRQASREELLQVHGIGPAKAEQLANALQNLDVPDRIVSS